MRYTVAMLETRIKSAMNQEKRALSLSDWGQAEWCRAAARLYSKQLEIAKERGYYEHEYEAIPGSENQNHQ